MFIVVYEFEIKEGTETVFRESWLEVTKAIYKHCGSFGSRLHQSDVAHFFVGYAQWPSREQWEKDHVITDELYKVSRQKMRDCLLESKVVYKLEVCDDFLR
ncbi:antibiotic biosynthesis monooxygenase [Oceanimonas baumannii]|uniref:antibiotic biosynthesis monooxygenase n=1 Tax=Oceanimonas baumannii TaxID=129578 RepID=UPI001D18601F|nr:antibiotic biosynthesis monooxygenase [Oceanimonas baumannii]MCC4265045.1 antibiotic biosynthesis monooxygenase [Oceanimonas baumannii]